ncbi:MAG: hypothetical protein ACKPKO_40815, partial [Candidatus Fonsibacter sp.]
MRCIESLAAFDLIDHYIRTNKLIKILNGDVEAHTWALINSRPLWKRTTTHGKSRNMFRNFDVGDSGNNGGPPPPGGSPPGGSPPGG